MNISNLSASQLRRAASTKDEIENLHEELSSILGPAAAAGQKKKRTMSPRARTLISASQKKLWAARRSMTVVEKPKAKRRMSAAAKKKLSDFHKARWAKIKSVTTAKPAPKKWKIGAAGMARIKAANKAYWAKKKAAQNK